MAEFGAIFYRGPSVLTGDPIVGAVTGLDDGSLNPKTGPIAQTWILRRDVAPMEAKRANLDDAICGDCKLRGRDGRNSGCYVTPWLAPYNVYRRLSQYPVVTWPQLRAVVEGRVVRLGAYGDPAAIPFEVWRTLLATSAGWVGYTHAWRTCDPRFRTIVMASVNSRDEFVAAGLGGWRTFRIRMPGDGLIADAEFVCPASDEGRHRATCQACQLCRGTSSPARSVAIYPHGKVSNLKVFRARAARAPSSRQLGGAAAGRLLGTQAAPACEAGAPVRAQLATVGGEAGLCSVVKER